MTATTTRNVKSQATRAVNTAKQSARSGVFSALGRELGTQMKRVSALDTEGAHKQYTKASEAKRIEMKGEFAIAYVAAYLGCTSQLAETIYGQTRAERNDVDANRERAVNGANKMFAFHVVRSGGKVAGDNKRVSVSTDFKMAAIEFVETFYEEANAAAIGEVIKQLQALKKRIK